MSEQEKIRQMLESARRRAQVRSGAHDAQCLILDALCGVAQEVALLQMDDDQRRGAVSVLSQVAAHTFDGVDLEDGL